MRVDVFLKTSRLIKRRSAARELCDRGGVRINGLPAKAGRELKAGDVIALSLPRRILTVGVIEIPSGNLPKERASGTYRIIEDMPVSEEMQDMELPLDERDPRPVLAITMGDPAGIGPEIILKALNVKAVVDCCRPIVIGSLSVLEQARGPLPLGTQRVLTVVREPGAQASSGAVEVVEPDMSAPAVVPGKPSADSGHISVACIKKAVDLVMDGKADAVVTAPITKETLKMAGYPYPGHTELLAELTGTKDFAMMLTGSGSSAGGGPSDGAVLRVVLATIHVPLRDVPGLVKKEGVLRTIRLADSACRKMGIIEPRVAVCGLNPHAGEGGLFGMEDINEIAPACLEARNTGINVSGPLPADTLFHRAHKGEFDAVVAMYHDQGLGPLKMFAFGNAVNVTLGLPIIRTSVDHGTAYDIAGRGIASPNSLVEAIKLAARMAGRRK